MSSIAERVQHETRDLRAVERAQLWAYLTMPGFAADLSPTTERKYRRIAQSLGVAVGSLELVEEAVVVRLDYDTGTEVVRAAA
jgi:hypothetical protein